MVNLWILSIFFKVGSFFHIFPYVFNPETRVVRIKEPKTYFGGIFQCHLLGFKVNTLAVFGNLVFGGFRILQSIYFLQKSFQDNMFQLFVFGLSLLSNVIQLNNLRFSAEMARFLTDFFLHEKRLTRKWTQFPIPGQGSLLCTN